MEYTEIEQKYRLNGDVQTVKDTLAGLNAEPGEPSRQVDTYYNAPHRDFLAPDSISEWLRVRVEDGKASLNFKRWHPIEQPIKTHCDEYESEVSDPQAVTLVLTSLDCKDIAVVDKVREEWMTADGQIAVAFDEVDGLGTFIEFEFKGDAESVEAATAVLDQFIASLGADLGDRINAGYPHMALGR
ncbi:class IV adenylate cyclase [Streptomyces sp. NBC_00829]|uniref:class IV adenylate cyclase n=1 Tax=Streptomyces sp. NBC_00829 TaxID=2903679 RepID=UPI003867FF55|nr:class IV adenylate cyclase [Streptomyces sp. NBC_00829]